ncbi:MAG: VOC family protein [Chitinophagaceae bacterium]|jgi:PhnB protein|nr:VOC family protein [Chitinophagaceae bacterium]
MIISFINFTGQAADAIAFYETVFEVKDKKIMLFKEMPENLKPHFPRDTDNWVMHAEMTINGTPVWIGDTTQSITKGNLITLAVPIASQEEVRSTFDQLKEGGEVLMNLEKTFYSPLFGVVKDKFSIIWHLMCREL